MVTGMRQGSLFAALRGRDGRSLAFALIALVLLSVFVGGFNAGAAAAGDRSLCLVDDAGGKALPDHDHKPDCCIVGASPFGSAASPPPPPAVFPRAHAFLPPAWPAAVAAAPEMLSGGATARGPPLEA